jgi:hypothetical protein
MVRKKRGIPNPTNRKIKEHTINEDKSFLLRNGQAMSLATHTAKGADTIDKTMNNEDIFQYLWKPLHIILL